MGRGLLKHSRHAACQPGIWRRLRGGIATMVVLACAACGLSNPQAAPRVEAPAPERPARTLTIAISREPSSVADKTLRQTGSGLGPDTSRPFNAGLVLRDQHDEPHPYLAAEWPALGTDTWRVFPDGRMETTFRLRPNLTWQDGQP